MNEYPRPAVDDARLPDLILPLAFREATPAARRLQRRATAALLGASAVVGLYVLARALGAVAGGLDVVLGVGVPLCAAAATWLVRLRLGRVAARVWTPLAAGTTLWALAIAIGAMPRPESSSRVLGTLLIFAAFGCWIFALAGLQQHTYLGSRLPHLIDALLVLVGGLTLAVHFVLGPILDGGIEPTQLLLRTGANLVLFILVIGFRYAAVGPLAPSVALMLTGILVLLLGDGQALWVAVGGHPHLPLLSGVAVMAAGLLFVGAAHRAVFPPTGPPRDRWEAFAPWLPLASLGAVLLLPTLRYTGQPISGLVLL
ncbi:MAG TPA: hypothetical protein VM536_02810, partial [Chloroflexia bacterium]|nr:hypothetical protein [Chloroflexia bacterium]